MRQVHEAINFGVRRSKVKVTGGQRSFGGASFSTTLDPVVFFVSMDVGFLSVDRN